MKSEIVGTRIGIYDVIYECTHKSNDGHKLYHCKCVICGWETDIQKRHITVPKSCRHKGFGNIYINNTIRWSNIKLRQIFRGMKSRCYNSNDKDYKFYGAKGIKISEDWLQSPLNFKKWAFSNGYKNGLTIDRIDSQRDYSPDNCRWITALENSKYKSTTKITTIDGISHTGREWADICQLGTNTINRMLRTNSEDKVVEFIKERLKNPTLVRHSHQTWFDVYNIN